MFIEWGEGYCLYYLGEGQVFIEWGVIVYIILGRCLLSGVGVIVYIILGRGQVFIE